MKGRKSNRIAALACGGWALGLLLGAALFRNPALWSLIGMAAGTGLGIGAARRGA